MYQQLYCRGYDYHLRNVYVSRPLQKSSASLMFKSIFSQSLNYNFTCKANCKHAKTELYWTRTMVGITKIMPIVRLFFSVFWIGKETVVKYLLSHSYLTGVTAAQLQWHLPNFNVIQSTWIYESHFPFTTAWISKAKYLYRYTLHRYVCSWSKV